MGGGVLGGSGDLIEGGICRASAPLASAPLGGRECPVQAGSSATAMV